MAGGGERTEWTVVVRYARRLALGFAVLTAAGADGVDESGQRAGRRLVLLGSQGRRFSFSTSSVQIYKRDGYVCAMTVPKDQQSRKRTMSVSVQARGSRPVVNRAASHHAAPVTVPRGRPLVRVQGSVGSGWVAGAGSSAEPVEC